jgi:hypothetical protein
MSTFLKVVRYIFAILFIIIILPIYFIGMPLMAVSQTFVNRENVKEIINDPVLYESVVDAFASSLTTMQDTESMDGMEDFIALFEEGSEFSENLERIITSDATKLKINTVIDAFYDWFEGKVDSPEFEVYLIEDEEVFKEMFTSVVVLRLENLPTCDDYSTQNLDAGIMELECIPPYVDSAEIEPMLEENLDQADFEEVMESIKFSSDQLNITYDDTVLVQSIYTMLKLLPILLIGSLLFLTVLVILLIPGFKGGFITTSVIYMLGSIFYLVIATLGKLNRFITSAINTTNLNIAYAQIQNLVNTLLSPILDRIMQKLTVYSIISLGIGIALLVCGILIKNKNKEIEPTIKEKDLEND